MSSKFERNFYASKAWRDIRAAVLVRDGFVCRIDGCGAPAAAVDHVMPLAVAPMLALEPSNLRACCTSCNSRRVRRPQRAGMGERRPSRRW